GSCPICGSPVTALESFALGCKAWITGILNVVPEAGAALMAERDPAVAREIYYRQILPVSDWIARTNNPSGVIKAGVTLRGIDCGAPRRPGRPLAADVVNEFARSLEEEMVR
ncbi:MAG: dihydrodipicolinate synthase family protein, partial [Bryobacteraceae bacterium]